MSLLLKTIHTLYALLVAFFVAFVGGFILLFPQVHSPAKITQTCVLPETIHGNVEIVSSSIETAIDCRRQDVIVAENGKLTFIGATGETASPEVRVRSLTVANGGKVDVVAIQNAVTPTILFAGTVSMQDQTVSNSAKVSQEGNLVAFNAQVLSVNTNEEQPSDSSYIQLSNAYQSPEVLGESVNQVVEKVFNGFSLEEFVASALQCSQVSAIERENNDNCYSNNSQLIASTDNPTSLTVAAISQEAQTFSRVASNRDIAADVLGASGKIVNLGGVVNQSGQVTLRAEVTPQFYFEAPKHIQLEFEVKTVQDAFDGTTGMFLSEPVFTNGTDPVSVSTTIDYLPQNQSFKWRVRVVEVATGDRGEWVSFGENGEEEADFVVSSASALRLEAERYSLGTEDKITITVTALNENGQPDVDYGGVIRFRSDSTSADLPKTYRFTKADKGTKAFTASVKFYEPGVRYITAFDAVNSSLTSTAAFTVTQRETEYFVLTANNYSLYRGERATMMWSSRGMTQILLPNGESSDLAAGTFEVTPSEDEYVSVRAMTPEGVTVYAGANITVNNADVDPLTREDIDPALERQRRINRIATPEVQGVNTVGGIASELFPDYLPEVFNENTEIQTIDEPKVCPTIEYFSYDKPFIKGGTIVHFSWKVKDAEQVVIDAIPGNLSLQGHAAMSADETSTITLKAIAGTCHRTMSLPITVVSVYPWEATGAWIIGIISLETLGLVLVPLAAPGVKFNLFFGLASVVDRLMKRRKWGVIFDTNTRKPIAGVKVSVYSPDKKILYDYAMSDNYGGIYLKNVAPGKYRIELEKVGYTLGLGKVSKKSGKSRKVTGEKYFNAITSSLVTVTKDGLAQQYNFPMTENKKETKKLMYHVMLLLEELATVSLPLFTIIGGAYAVAITLLYPVTMNLMLLTMYLLIVLAKMLNYLFTRYTVGQVRTVTGIPVANVQIALYDRKSETLIARTTTDKSGRYVFFAAKGDYNIAVVDSNYRLVNKGRSKLGITVTNKEQTEDQISVGKNITVYPAMPL
ncbi:MAG: hypothetical protein QY314_02890 [Candidatus Dojkabacteria bacterium]|nr:MAG: hypothetical protein QY314_02890 [Candidatus Dojkabacteria bacterium]